MCLTQVHSDTLASYFLDGYAAVRAACPQCFVTICAPSWEQGGTAFQNFMTGPGYTNVFQDLHRCLPFLPAAGPRVATSCGFAQLAGCVIVDMVTARQ